MAADANAIRIVDEHADTPCLLPSRLDSDHDSPCPTLDVVPDQPAADPELLARIRAGLLRL